MPVDTLDPVVPVVPVVPAKAFAAAMSASLTPNFAFAAAIALESGLDARKALMSL